MQLNDLISRSPSLSFHNLAMDGATIGDVFGEQLSQIAASDERTLVTLTAGGNDLLSAFENRPRASLLEAIQREVMDAYDFLVDAVRRAIPKSVVLLTSIYDPSDDTGRIPGTLASAGKLPLHVLRAMNEHIETLADGTPDVLFADAYQWFLGHGVTAPPAEQWYWKRSLVEPSALGADALRRLWLEVLDRADAGQ